MIGILVLLLLSWALLRWRDMPFTALGIDKPRRRTVEFAAGFAFLGAVQAVRLLGWAALGEFRWEPVPGYGLVELSVVMYPLLKSVLFEELLFRGALLVLAIRALGEFRGIALNAVAFGVYHWFSYGILGQVMPMVWVFTLTASAGLLFAAAFARSGSIILPIGLHLGTNTITAAVFSQGPWGTQWLEPVPAPSDTSVVAMLGLNLLWPIGCSLLAVAALYRLYPRSSVAPSRRPPRS